MFKYGLFQHFFLEISVNIINYYKAYQIIFPKCKSNYLPPLLKLFKGPKLKFRYFQNGLWILAQSSRGFSLDSPLLHDSTLLLHSCWALCSASSAPNIFYWTLTCWSLCLECLSLLFTWLSPANPSSLHLDIISCMKFSLKHHLPTRSRLGSSPMWYENTWTSHVCAYCRVWKLNAHVPISPTGLQDVWR